jgi:hypothetical protein
MVRLEGCRSMMGLRAAAVAAGAMIAWSAAAIAAQPGSSTLVPHRAIYDLTLADKSPRKQVSGVSGRMVYEMNGSVCDGWTTQFRFVSQMIDADGGSARITDLRTSSFEEADGSLFDFLNQSMIDQRITEEAKGTAKRVGTDVAIALERPVKKDLKIAGGAMFPTQHLNFIIDNARAGATVVAADVYDGSETGERVFATTAVVGREQTGVDDVGPETAAAVPVLAQARRWPVTISYFDGEKSGGEDTPDYQISFLLYANGVSRRMTLDYGDLIIEARMVKFEALPERTCP